MKIILRKKTVYGRDLYYPVCDKSEIFADMLGQKTLNEVSLRLIQELGFEITLEADKFTL